MIFSDYTYYKEKFCGKLIPQDDFLYFAARASEYIDWQTFGRLEKGIPEEYDAKVRNCCCALAETEYSFSQKADISSEKNGSYSVTYSSKNNSDHNTEKRRIIARYLGNTGLLYKGV